MPAQDHERDLGDAEVTCLTPAGSRKGIARPAGGHNVDVSINYGVARSGGPEPPHGTWPPLAQIERGSGPFQEAVQQVHSSLRRVLDAREVAQTMEPWCGRRPGSPGGESPDRQEGSYVLNTAVLDAAEAYVRRAAHDQRGFLVERGSVAVGNLEFGDLMGLALEQVALSRAAAHLGSAAHALHLAALRRWGEAVVGCRSGRSRSDGYGSSRRVGNPRSPVPRCGGRGLGASRRRQRLRCLANALLALGGGPTPLEERPPLQRHPRLVHLAAKAGARAGGAGQSARAEPIRRATVARPVRRSEGQRQAATRREHRLDDARAWGPAAGPGPSGRLQALPHDRRPRAASAGAGGVLSQRCGNRHHEARDAALSGVAVAKADRRWPLRPARSGPALGPAFRCSRLTGASRGALQPRAGHSTAAAGCAAMVATTSSSAAAGSSG